MFAKPPGHRPSFVVVLGLLLVALGVPARAQQSELPVDSSSAQSGELSAADWAGLRAARDFQVYMMKAAPGGHVAQNPGQAWAANFDGRGFSLTPKDGEWEWGLQLESMGFPGAQFAISAGSQAQADGGRLAYAWSPTLEEWFINDGRGLEHGFTLRAQPTGVSAGSYEPLEFNLGIRGPLHALETSDQRGILFQDDNARTVVRYTGLVVHDALGRDLPALLLKAMARGFGDWLALEVRCTFFANSTALGA
jgi:hypothetical protein